MAARFMFLIVGLILILISSPMLYFMGQEVYLQQKVSKQYKIQNIYHPMDMTADFNTMQYLQDGTMLPFPEMKRKVYLNGQEVIDYDEYINAIKDTEQNELSRIVTFYDTDISISDTFIGTTQPDARKKSKVHIMIDGVNVAEPVDLELRPNHLDNNRYHGYLGMLKMTKLDTKEERLVVVQRLFEEPFSTPETEFKWKLISVDTEGLVETEVVTRNELADPAYRRDLIQKATVSPYALGYKSNVLQGYPSLIFPLIYPYSTLLIGIICVMTSGLFIMMRKKKNRTID